MIVGLLVGKNVSLGLPGKHRKEVLGRPLVEYPILAAHNSKLIEKLFVSTDSPFISEMGKRYNGTILERPKELAKPDTLLEDSLVFAYKQMSAHVSESIDIVALLFGNSPMVSSFMIDQGIEILKNKTHFDTVFSAAKFNMFAPTRAHKIDSENIVQPFVDVRSFGNISSIRDSQGDCYFCTLQVQIMRARCFTHMDDGQLPYKWMGRKSYALKTDVGFDIDYEWQLPVAEYWLLKNGYTKTSTPYS